METHDIANGSPTFIANTPHFYLQMTNTDLCKNILFSWFYSARQWLNDFMPWQEAINFLNKILLNSTFRFTVKY
jgi:hypothetical protein